MSLCLNKQVEAELRSLPGNNICVDCNAKLPQWASVSFGVFMCLECSGRHRGLGVHISFVRSVSMDSWTEKQIQKMRVGGNDKFTKFLSQYNVPKNTPIAQKYNSPAAQLYRDRITATVEGTPLPTELPKSTSSSTLEQGSDPLPGESEEQYVARQRKLQAEARERMRQKFGNSTGLKSGGAMAGIGSDPNYQPGKSGGGIAVPIDLTAVTEASQQALDFVTQSFASLGTQSKGSQQQGTPAADPWASLAAGATDWWTKATEATTDIVNIINAPPEEDFKFPRPPPSMKEKLPDEPPSKGSIKDRAASQKQRQKQVNSTESWDNLDEFTNDSTTPPLVPSSTQMGTPTGASGSSRNNKSRTKNRSNTSLASLESSPRGGDDSSPRTNSGISPQKMSRDVSANSLASGGSTSSKSSVKDAPVGADFFANFGI